MLEYLKLQGVGPAAEMEMEIAPRLNLVTGDNGLGKSFLLDVAWWVLTGNWARLPAAPQPGVKGDARISSRRRLAGEVSSIEAQYARRQQRWISGPYSGGPLGKPPDREPVIAIYAKVDGSFSVYDSSRDQLNGELHFHYAAFHFESKDVWDGLPSDSAKKVCLGLIQDWASWQREQGEAFQQLTRVLRHLSPSPEEPLVPGELRRVSLDDGRDHPTLMMPYGQEVPLVYGSAGIRRIVALSYILVWTWQEHLRACELLGIEPVQEIHFLVDEIEAHLHPQWQRRVVRALLDVMSALGGKAQIPVQLLASTHAPLVLASLEPYFDATKDAIFELDLIEDKVELVRVPWQRHGDVNSWLSSSVFDLGEPRSLEAEQAMTKAKELAKRDPRPTIEEIEEVDRELRRVLSDVDTFWIHWSYFVETARGGA